MARGVKKDKADKVLTPEERLAAALVPVEERPYEVPRNWLWTRLGNITVVIGGGIIFHDSTIYNNRLETGDPPETEFRYTVINNHREVITMKALSIRPEYTFDIFMGEQTYEERTWQTDYRGDLLICASSKKEPGYVNGHAYFVIPLLDIKPSDEEWYDENGKAVTMYEWTLGAPRAIQPIPVKGKLHLYDVDDALIHYVEGGDLGAYGTREEADAFREAYIAKYLDPLAYKPKRAPKVEKTEYSPEVEEFLDMTDEALAARRPAAQKAYQAILGRISVIREWIDKGVFNDSVSDPDDSANLGPLPDLCALEFEELDNLLLEMENLENDLRENEPPKRTPAYAAWTALLRRIDEYAVKLDDLISGLQAATEEAIFNGEIDP